MWNAKVISIFAILALAGKSIAMELMRDTLYEPSLIQSPAYNSAQTRFSASAFEIIDSIRYEGDTAFAKVGYLPELQLQFNRKTLYCHTGKCGLPPSYPAMDPTFKDTLFRDKGPASLAFQAMDACVAFCPVYFQDCPCACQNQALYVVHLILYTRIPGYPPGRLIVNLMGDTFSCAARYANPFNPMALGRSGTADRKGPSGRKGCGCQINGRKTEGSQRLIRIRPE